MIGVAVFGLVTFTITGPLIQTITGRGKGKETTITLPSGKVYAFTEEDRVGAGNAYNMFFEAPDPSFPITRLQRIAYNNFNFREPNPFPKLTSQAMRVSSWVSQITRPKGGLVKKGKDDKNDEVMQIMMVNAVARDRGMEVGEAEMKEFVESGFESAVQYRLFCERGMGISPAGFELGLREALLFRRAMDFALAQTPIPSGDDLVKEWCELNERFKFELVSFSEEDRKKALEADKAKITNDELKKWLDDLRDMDRNKYKDPKKLELEGLAIRDVNAPLNPEFKKIVDGIILGVSDSQSYFDMNRAERFKKEKTASAPIASNPVASKPESGPASQTAPEFYTYEEAKDRVEKETKIARALDKVLTDAFDASKTPNFDLKTFGEKYGLEYWTSGAPATESDIIHTPIFGTPAWIAPLETSKEGDFLPSAHASASALEIARVKRITEPRIPEVADIREKLISDYVEKKAGEQTKNEAQLFKEAVADAQGDDRFARVAKDKGMVIKSLESISKALSQDPLFNLHPDTKDPVRFIAMQRDSGSTPALAAQRDPFVLKKDAVGGPYNDASNKVYYIIHCADRKEATKAEMGPSDYLRFRDRYLRELRERNCYETMSSVSLGKLLKIEVPKREVPQSE